MGSVRQINVEPVLLLFDVEFCRFPPELFYEDVDFPQRELDRIRLKSAALQSDNRVFMAFLHP